MGCDIHFFTEVKINGNWKFAGKLEIKRDYSLFTKLADVRNHDNEDIVPISYPRNIPNDADELTKLILSDEDFHSHSYLSLGEFEQIEDWYIQYQKKNDYRYLSFYYPDYLLNDDFTAKFEEFEDVRFVFAFDN